MRRKVKRTGSKSWRKHMRKFKAQARRSGKTEEEVKGLVAAEKGKASY